LYDKAGMKKVKAVKYDEAVEYFRGVEFHIFVLQHANEIMKMIPHFKDDIKQLKYVEDSIKLGQYMLFVGILQRVTYHPNLPVTPNSKGTKPPKFLADDLQIFDHTGLYVHIVKVDKKTQSIYLFMIIAGLMFIVFFDQYPYWMQEFIW